MKPLWEKKRKRSHRLPGIISDCFWTFATPLWPIMTYSLLLLRSRYRDDFGTSVKPKCHHFDEIAITACQKLQLAVKPVRKMSAINIFVSAIFTTILTPFWHIMICLQLLQWGHYRYDSGSPLKRKYNHFHEIALLPPKMETYSATKMTTFTCDYGMFTTAAGTIATVLAHHDMFATATVEPILTRLWHIMTFVPLLRLRPILKPFYHIMTC